MTKALNKRRPKGEIIKSLDQQIELGRALRDRAIADELELAWASVEKLSWRLEVLKLLPHMSKGIQVAADFNRAGYPSDIPLGTSLAEELAFFRHLMDAQLEGLVKAVDRWRKSNTRPLT